MAYVNFPSYELAAMSPKDIEQVLKHLPHNSAAALRGAWREAVHYHSTHDHKEEAKVTVDLSRQED